MGILYYRKRPVIVQAVHYDGTRKSVAAINEMADDKAQWFGEVAGAFLIYTLEGTMWATKGDWIIKGIRGEVYPCNPDIFEASYDPCNPDIFETAPGSEQAASNKPK